MQSPTTDMTGGMPRSKVPTFGLIEDHLGEVRRLVRRQLKAPVKAEPAVELLDYLNTRSGKMLRPGLVLLAGAAVGRITDQHVRIAAMVELIHNATLLHDDVIDEGQTRRGAPTVNNLWGNESAVLLGDLLLSHVFQMCADLEPRLVRIIAATAARTCQGELRQINARQNWQLSEAEYIDIITEKSAVFISSCCRLGALLAQGTEAAIESLAHFGLNTGIAFQIADDLLDITGEEQKTGKTAGRDADKYKPTLPVIHLLRAASEKDKGRIYDTLNGPGSNQDVLAEMLRSYGSLEYARHHAQDYVARAIHALRHLRETDAREALIETARFVANRAT